MFRRRAVSFPGSHPHVAAGCRSRCTGIFTLAELTCRGYLEEGRLYLWRDACKYGTSQIACCRYALSIVSKFVTLTALCGSPLPRVPARVAGRPIFESYGEHAQWQFKSHEHAPSWSTIVLPTYHCATAVSCQDGDFTLVPRACSFDMTSGRRTGLALSRHYSKASLSLSCSICLSSSIMTRRIGLRGPFVAFQSLE